MNYRNNAFSVLALAASSVDTALTLAAGAGARFPAGDFLATLVGYDGSGNENSWEIVLCTTRASDTLTVVRAQEGSVAVAWPTSTRIENRVTAGTMASLAPLTGAGTSGTWPISITGGAATAPWAGISGKPAVIASGATQAGARAAIGAGTSSLTLGISAGTALAGDTVVLPEAPSDGKTYGRKDAAWVESLKLGTTSTTALAGDTIIPSGGNTTNNIGYLNIPQNSQSAAYTCVLADAGKHILHPAADTTARTFTIPANASVAYPIGTAITFVNQNGTSGVVTIAITTDTMRLAGAGTTGSRTLARNGVATAVKITATEWLVSGSGLT